MKTADRIGTRRLAMHFDATFHQPLNVINVHTVFYFRYFTYKKFPIDLWEELCSWRNGTKRSYILDWTLGKSLQFVKHDGDLLCPLFGNYSLNIDSISQDYFAIPPMVPSGRYRMDLNVTEADRNNVIVASKLFFAVSDHRVEQF